MSSWIGPYSSCDYTREVFYIRANGDPGARDYYVLRDSVSGPGERSLEQRWHFGVGSSAKVDESTLTSTVVYPESASLTITQVDPSRLKLEQTKAKVWRPRGVDVPPNEIPVMLYKTRTALPAAIDTALFPSDLSTPSTSSIPSIKTLETSADGLSSVFKIVQGKTEDLFVLQKAAGSKTLAAEKLDFDGERLFLRKVAGKLRSVLLVNGSSLTMAGKQVTKSDKPMSWVAVSFDQTGTTVYTSDSQPGLTVGASNPKFMATGSDKLLVKAEAK